MSKIPLLAAAAAISLTLLSTVPSQAAPPLDSPGPVTSLTLRVVGCDGCTFGVASYLEGSMDVWSAKPRKVKDGVVTFAVPTGRTTGLSVTVRAPWEGATGYVTNVALRYRGFQPGDKVGFTLARAARRASGCWAGTTDDATTMKVLVRRVKVQGQGGEVPGTIAWTKVTQEWLRPLVPAWHGVVGTQDVMPCAG
jgi:hypothetical protein